MGYNPTTNRTEPPYSAGGSSFVIPAVLGSPATLVLSATTSDPSATTTYFSSATGVKQAVVFPVGAIGTNHVVVGYSATEAAVTTVAAAVNAVVSNFSTTGGAGTANTVVLNAANPREVLTFDGDETIKTIAGEANAGTIQYVVQTVS